MVSIIAIECEYFKTYIWRIYGNLTSTTTPAPRELEYNDSEVVLFTSKIFRTVVSPHFCINTQGTLFYFFNL